MRNARVRTAVHVCGKVAAWEPTALQMRHCERGLSYRAPHRTHSHGGGVSNCSSELDPVESVQDTEGAFSLGE